MKYLYIRRSNKNTLPNIPKKTSILSIKSTRKQKNYKDNNFKKTHNTRMEIKISRK